MEFAMENCSASICFTHISRRIFFYTFYSWELHRNNHWIACAFLFFSHLQRVCTVFFFALENKLNINEKNKFQYVWIESTWDLNQSVFRITVDAREWLDLFNIFMFLCFCSHSYSPSFALPLVCLHSPLISIRFNILITYAQIIIKSVC